MHTFIRILFLSFIYIQITVAPLLAHHYQQENLATAHARIKPILFSDTLKAVEYSNRLTHQKSKAFKCGTSTVSFEYLGELETYGTVESNGRCWLDRNLGAQQTAVHSQDDLAYGDLFQWGRKSDNHQLRNAPSTDILANNNNHSAPYFITTQETSRWSNWTNKTTNDSWNHQHSNNPCPQGWRPPTSQEWKQETMHWEENNSSGAMKSNLNLPLTGIRDINDAAIQQVGDLGFYWTSESANQLAKLFVISASDADIYAFNRAFGAAVRCIHHK